MMQFRALLCRSLGGAFGVFERSVPRLSKKGSELHHLILYEVVWTGINDVCKKGPDFVNKKLM